MELRASLRAEPGEVAVARRLLRGYLCDQEPTPSDNHDVPVLLVSELVTNAIRHAQPPLALHALTRDGGLRVEVHDGGSDPPMLVAPSLPGAVLKDGGRGLQLVATLADRWGWDGNALGKAVWFELDAL
ncbi:MAG TPA: ATP-binding protein [Ornithinibacter sp.]|nr:ATP-binding protein [Ornithinibacter sp.]